jgi:hypothetical protein
VTGHEHLEWQRALVAERERIVRNLLALLGGTKAGGVPVCLRYLDSAAENETFYGAGGRVVGYLRTVVRGQRTLLVVEAKFYVDD